MNLSDGGLVFTGKPPKFGLTAIFRLKHVAPNGHCKHLTYSIVDYYTT